MDQALLERICNAPGIPGFEGDAQQVAREVLSACSDEVKRDALGNVIAYKKATRTPEKGTSPLRVMIEAHVDEIGMMVKHINKNGYIHFIQLGGLNTAVLQSQRVIIHGKTSTRGVIVPKGAKETPDLTDLLIDTGLPKDELEKRIRPGDTITFEDDVSRLNDKMWVGRNFDNRIGSYCLLDAMRKLDNTQVDVIAVSTTQEEVGLRGARAAAFSVAPDIAIAIDGSMARGSYVADHNNLCDPGKGTGIYVADKLTIGHPALVQYLCDVCDEHKIAYQRNIGGGTNAAAIQQSVGGIVTTTIGAPVRYMHSTVQLCHADDMDATVDLLVRFLETAHIFWQNLPS